jgi:hypothetical protein
MRLVTYVERILASFIMLNMYVTILTVVLGIVYSAERCLRNAQGCCKQLFIVLIKLPGHASASKCHLQGAYAFLIYKLL